MDEDILNVILFISGLAFFSHIGIFVFGMVVGRNYLSTTSKTLSPVRQSGEKTKDLSQVVIPDSRKEVQYRQSVNRKPYRVGSRKLVIPL